MPKTTDVSPAIELLESDIADAKETIANMEQALEQGEGQKKQIDDQMAATRERIELLKNNVATREKVLKGLKGE